MYAIIRTGGKQYKVSENESLSVEKLDTPVGQTVELAEVLMVAGDGEASVGTPLVSGATVVCKVTRQYRGRKINGFTYRPKKHSARRYGHRQSLTQLLVQKINVEG